VPAASPVIEQVVAHLDHLFVGIRVGAEAVQAATSTPVSFLLPAVDTLAISPAVSVDDRRIDVSNRGRRDPRQHELLASWARRTGAFYEFDTLRDGVVAEPFEHRRHYYEQTARSLAFVANPARFDLPELSAGVAEVGLRYLEALACGTVLIGDHPPGSACRRTLGDPPGVADLPAGAPALGGELEQLLGAPSTLHELGLANRAWALAHHDVVHRWDVMAATLGITGPAAVDQRRAALRIASGLVQPGAAVQERLATAASSAAR
jgi:hypothetical protein